MLAEFALQLIEAFNTDCNNESRPQRGPSQAAKRAGLYYNDRLKGGTDRLASCGRCGVLDDVK